jgi:dihydroorotase
MASLVLKGGRVVSPGDRVDDELDVLVEDGVVRKIAPRITERADKQLDARGRIVSPGFVDLHVHLREPGGEGPMPNTRPVNDRPEITRALVEKARRLGLARVFPIAAVSMGSEGESLVDFAALLAAGAVAFSDDGRPVKTAALMRAALEKGR